MGLGNMRGAGVLGAVEYFARKYGPAAMHATITHLSPASRAFVRPNTPNFGLVPGQLYPNAFLGDLGRAMVAAVRVDEDVFIRDFAGGGIDANLTSIHRIAIRLITSIETYMKRSQQLWDLYHDSGRVSVLPTAKNELLVQLHDWAAHDPFLCKVNVEGRRRILELLGLKNVQARRDKCQAWGHGVCLASYRWSD
jgi:hypothetical protein